MSKKPTQSTTAPDTQLGDLSALERMLLTARETPVALKTLRWLEISRDIVTNETRLMKLESERGDRTMAKMVRDRLSALTTKKQQLAMAIADIPAVNAKDISCKLNVATHQRPDNPLDADTLFKLANSSRRDIQTFLKLSNARAAKP